MKLSELVARLDTLLAPGEVRDYGPNGLQFEGRAEVSRVALGVTACQAFLDRAAVWGADATLVHHGLFWNGAPLALAGLCFAGDLALWHWSIRLTSVANATLLANAAPIFVALGGWLLFAQRFTGTFIVGMLLALAGAAVLMGQSLSLDPGRLAGDALGLLTALFYAGYILAVGRFLELARIAAAERGYAMEIEPFPEGEDPHALDRRPIARLRFTQNPAVARDPLFDQITRRRSNKEEYDLSKPVSQSDLAKVVGDGDTGTIDPEWIAALREQIVAGIDKEITTPKAYMESVNLMRISAAEVDANPDGISLNGPMFEIGKMLGLVDRAALAEMDGAVFKQGLSGLRATYGSIPALFWIVTPGNSRVEQLEAGRRYVRANLRATALGLGMHPMSQCLQEYEEVAPMYARVHELLGATGKQRVQMIARIGYGPAVGPAPRWPMETHLQAPVT